jgi:DNA polymerase III subunit delta'
VSFFSEFIGNTVITDALQSDIEQQNISQAYLLCGPKHIGKRTLAKLFAKTLLTKDASTEWAGVVQKELRNMVHSDVIVLDVLYQHGIETDWDVITKYSNAPQDHRKKNQSKSDTISIDDVRALQKAVYETPVGKYKICIITNCNRLNTAAANALLKILEEPPPHLVFILTAEHCEQLLPTVISRTRVVRLQPVGNRELSDALSEQDEALKQFILHVAQGAPGTALTLQKNPSAVAALKQVHDQAKLFWQTASAKERLDIAKPLLEIGNDADVLLQQLAIVLKEHEYPLHYTQQFLHLCSQLQTNAYKPLIVYTWLATLHKS